MTTAPEQSAEVAATPSLRCPACGNDGTRRPLRYVLEVVSSADVVAIRAPDVVEISGPPTRSPADEPSRPQLECRAVDRRGRVCGRRFDLPAGIRAIAWRAGP